MSIICINTPTKDSQYDVNVVLCGKKSSPKANAKILVKGTKDIADIIEDAAADEAFSANRDETVFFRNHISEKCKHTMAVGLGDESTLTLESFRRLGAISVKELIRHKNKSAKISIKGFGSKWQKKTVEVVGAFTEGMLLGAYQFDDHLEKKYKGSLDKFAFVASTAAQKKQGDKAIKTARATCEAINFGRWLGDNPGNLMNPVTLAKEIQKEAKGTGLKITVWDKARLKKEKMELLLGVGQGSSIDSRLIIIEYKGAAASKKPVCFVGKGITFDTGGISLKPPQSMQEMKYDMCGAANVIGTMFALAKTKAKTNAFGIIVAAENMPGPSATKPGDIHKARNGKTVEVFNTDAEGRLALADGLCLATEKKPRFIIDAATLTGAMTIALGPYHTGYFVRDEALEKPIKEALKISEEPAWELPLTQDHAKLMKGDHADLKNIGGRREAGSAQGAAFLCNFVGEDIPFAHFDIAGTAWNIGSLHPYCPNKGASGVMVRTFVELATNF